MDAFNRILVPVDFSAHSDLALCYATTIANRFGASVEALHVVEDPFVSGAWSTGAIAPNIPELLADLVRVARAKLDDMSTAAANEGMRLTSTILTTVATGEPADSISCYATTGKFDLIVMGTHGRRGLSHALMGSVAERVVRKAPCPVLTVREMTPDAREEAPVVSAAAV